jgi:hypothetical protein
MNNLERFLASYILGVFVITCFLWFYLHIIVVQGGYIFNKSPLKSVCYEEPLLW